MKETLMKLARYTVALLIVILIGWQPVTKFATDECHGYGGYWSWTGCNR